MSKHISRKARWSSHGPFEHRSAEGKVFYRAGQWHAAVVYRTFDPETLLPGEIQSWVLARFKRPRNAMMAVEDKVRELQRRYGKHVVFLLAGLLTKRE